MNETPKNIRVLIADDNAATRAAIIALLEAGPHRAVFFEAADGLAAVQLAESIQPHVIVMDVQMPRLDGLEATRRIKRRRPVIRVVTLTMYETHREAAFNAGADEFLIKGGSADELLLAVFQDRNDSGVFNTG